MVEIKDLAPIGFGTYRLKEEAQKEVIDYAINNGCNLIDTASNYGNGEAEKLIGESINSSGKSKDVFIISKAGYITNPIVFDSQLTEKDLFAINSNTWYSIHPIVLDYELSKSLIRLKRDYIDGYLLHNPEYIFNSNKNDSILYEQIERAFKFLEKKVDQGRIRFYGISSNNLPKFEEGAKSIDLSKLMQIAKKIKKNNHFKIIQFPYNLFEKDAYLYKYKQNKNLIEYSHANMDEPAIVNHVRRMKVSIAN
ncbi:MAG: aldo/keto reductase [Zunongwangia sp.]|uniref:aldo/keto reductase n=1 Tax=Zunongwangia sp. TaxID=1965325 RepID=UPI003241F556